MITQVTNTTRPTFKKARILKGTQKMVAADLGVTETFIRNIESGRSKPSLELAFTFSLYFKVPMEKLWPDIVESSKSRLKTI